MSARIPLPAPAARFTPARKEAIVAAIRAGQITRATALRAYALTEEELEGWEVRFDAFGQRGLKVTQLQMVGR